jgi:myosin-crossreactive antigen
MCTATYTQQERIQGRRSIKKRKKREDIITWGYGLYRCAESNFQLLEVDELGGQHWSVNILKNDKSQDYLTSVQHKCYYTYHSSLYT